MGILLESDLNYRVLIVQFETIEVKVRLWSNYMDKWWNLPITIHPKVELREALNNFPPIGRWLGLANLFSKQENHPSENSSLHTYKATPTKTKHSLSLSQLHLKASKWRIYACDQSMDKRE